MVTTKRDILKAIANRTHAIAYAATNRSIEFIDGIWRQIFELENDIAWCDEQIAYVDSEFAHGRLDWTTYDEYVTGYENDISRNVGIRFVLSKSIQFAA